MSSLIKKNRKREVIPAPVTVHRDPPKKNTVPVDSIEWMLDRIMAMYGRKQYDEKTGWYRDYKKVAGWLENVKKQ